MKILLRFTARFQRGFSPLELILVIAVFLFLASLLFAFLSNSWRDARDQERISGLRSLSSALKEYYRDFQEFPKESEGANGNVEDNEVLRSLLAPYLAQIPADPAGPAHSTFFYYYDGAHRCGNNLYAAVFARQMDKTTHANYEYVRGDICNGTLDEEGRAGGSESYTIILGPSGESR
jgi:type II secretory pathway pseudopilin PulG